MRGSLRPRFSSRSRRGVWLFLSAVLAGTVLTASAVDTASNPTTPEVPANFPDFVVPGYEDAMKQLRQIYYSTYRRDISDLPSYNMAWIAPAVIWAGVSEEPSESPSRSTLLQRLRTIRMQPDGYVSCHQHEGLGLSEGWPFPLYLQSQGAGWLFSMAGMPYGKAEGVYATKDYAGWTFQNAVATSLDEVSGLNVRLEKAGASITSPPISVVAPAASWVRLKFVPGPLALKPSLEWTTAEHPEFSTERSMPFEVPAQLSADGVADVDIPIYRLTNLEGTITGLRINFGNSTSGNVRIIRFFTAVDTRHNYNNANFILVAATYFNWTNDLDYLREDIDRLRKAFVYSMTEFKIRENGVLTTLWPNKDGTSGLTFDAQGNKVIRYGYGVGSNYWDLLPFGGKDGYSSIYQYAAVKAMADLEQQIQDHPEWKIPAPDSSYTAAALRKDVDHMRDSFQKTFWDASKGRFVGAVDLTGQSHDYGYTFVNNEAMHYGLASPDQSRQIVDWISGKRIVDGDTSTGSDIYHFRFGPRSTTRRNIDYYTFSWTGPESIPFGYQVQDGGAVFGFSFHDLIGRLNTNGADDAWDRLQEILVWFSEVQREGGYRKYYRPELASERGTLQGGAATAPGGLGLDAEFWETILVPLILTDGFMGLRVDGNRLSVNPRLPSAWPSLKVTRIQYHNWTVDIQVAKNAIELDLQPQPGSTQPLDFELPAGSWQVSQTDPAGQEIALPPIQNVDARILSLPVGKVVKLKATRS